jgi:flagellar protein FlgJ
VSRTIGGSSVPFAGAASVSSSEERAAAGAETLAARAEAQGKKQDGAGLVRTARELEGVFLGMVFEAMAEGVGQDDSLFPATPGRDMFQSWFRTEVAKQWANGGGTGLGDTIARSLAKNAGVELPAGGPISLDALSPRAPAAPLGPPPRAEAAAGASRSKPAIGLAPPLPGPPSAPASAPGRLPVDGPITSHFGGRTHPVTHRHDFHNGIDLAVPVGTPVRVPFDGTVVEVERHPNLGLKVVVEHKGGFRSLYGHNSAIEVRVGQPVAAGEVIARSGNTGRSTGLTSISASPATGSRSTR